MYQNLLTSFFLAWRGIIRGGKGSAYLTILIIAMVFTNMIFVPSIVMGVVKSVEKQVIDYQVGNILISPVQDEEYIEDANALIGKLNRISGVDRAAAHYSISATLKNKGHRVGSEVTAIDPPDEEQVTGIHTKMKEGDYLSEGETGQIIIGIDIAGHKDPAEDAGKTLGYVRVGDPVTIEFSNGITKTYRVKGIYETGTANNDQGVFISRDELESIYGHEVSTATEVLVKTFPDTDEAEVKTQILRNGVREKVKTYQELLEKEMQREVENFEILNIITLIVSLVIAIVVLFIVIMIKTLNNKRQIGVLKAIGLSRSVIIQNYLIQVLILAISGVILGIIVVEGMVELLTLYPLQFPEGPVTPFVTLADLLNNTVLLFIAASIAGYIPARQIAGEDIITVMRA